MIRPGVCTSVMLQSRQEYWFILKEGIHDAGSPP